MGRVVVLSTILCCACGQPVDVSLWGSIDETFSLAFDEIQIQKQGTVLLIEYVRTIGSGATEKPCKLVIETADLSFFDLESVDYLIATEMAEAFEDGTAVLDRVTIAGGNFPPVESGSLHLDQYQQEPSSVISGDFTVVFENGRNLFGSFIGELPPASSGE